MRAAVLLVVSGLASVACMGVGDHVGRSAGGPRDPAPTRAGRAQTPPPGLGSTSASTSASLVSWPDRQHSSSEGWGGAFQGSGISKQLLPPCGTGRVRQRTAHVLP